MPVTSAQVRMARAALNWSVRDLAEASGLHRNTITNIEVGRYAGTLDSLALIESVLRKAGIEFLPQNGVSLHEPRVTRGIQLGTAWPGVQNVERTPPYSVKKTTPTLNPLSSGQIRAGRALLRWSAEELAHASTVGITTIRRAELTEHRTALTAANDLAIRHALEAAGIEFIDQNGGGAGVRLREPTPETNRDLA
jgi:transcriptional regulator with XRE-family HTH domain